MATTDNYKTLTYARDAFVEPMDDISLSPSSKMPRVVRQLMMDRLDMDKHNSNDLGSYNFDYMDNEFDDILMRTKGKVFIDKETYPQTAKMGDAVPRIIQGLFNGDTTAPTGDQIIGTVTIGSSEAIMLGLIANREIWRAKWLKRYSASTAAQAKYIDDRPFVIFARDVHTCWNKYSKYFNCPAVILNLKDGKTTLDLGDLNKWLHYTIAQIRELALSGDVEGRQNWYTISNEMNIQNPNMARYINVKDRHLFEFICCVGTVVGSTFSGEGDNVVGANDILDAIKTSTNGEFDLTMHVDAASGGFTLPFVNPANVFDFRNSHVISINVSNHKFGGTYPGCGTVVFRSATTCPADVIYNISYLGGNFTDYTVNFSRGSSMVLGAYYNLQRLGREGYDKLAHQCVANAAYLNSQIAAMKSGTTPMFKTISDTKNYPMAIWKMNDVFKPAWTMKQIADRMQAYGWLLPAYNLPYTSSEKPDGPTVMRVVTRQDVSRSKIDIFMVDFKQAIADLDARSAYECSGSTDELHAEKRAEYNRRWTSSTAQNGDYA